MHCVISRKRMVAVIFYAASVSFEIALLYCNLTKPKFFFLIFKERQVILKTFKYDLKVFQYDLSLKNRETYQFNLSREPGNKNNLLRLRWNFSGNLSFVLLSLQYSFTTYINFKIFYVWARAIQSYRGLSCPRKMSRGNYLFFRWLSKRSNPPDF